MGTPRIQSEQIAEALRRSGGNVAVAAGMLAADPSTVRRRLVESPHLRPVKLARRRPAPTAHPHRLALPPSALEATAQALLDAGGNVAVAARVLGLSRQGLHDRLAIHGIWPEGVPRESRPAVRAKGAVYRFYLAQFGCVWSVTAEALRRVLTEGSAGGGYSISGVGVRELAVRFSEASAQRREDVPKRWRRPGVVLLRPVRWTREDFATALLALDEGRYEDLRG